MIDYLEELQKLITSVPCVEYPVVPYHDAHRLIEKIIQNQITEVLAGLESAMQSYNKELRNLKDISDELNNTP